MEPETHEKGIKHACFVQTLIKEWGFESNNVWFIIHNMLSIPAGNFSIETFFEWQPPIIAISPTSQNPSSPEKTDIMLVEPV